MEPIWNGNKENRETLKPVHGILMFLLVMVCFYTVIAWVQRKFGMYGLALTELLLLLLSTGGAKILKVPFQEIFPVKNQSGGKFQLFFCVGFQHIR